MWKIIEHSIRIALGDEYHYSRDEHKTYVSPNGVHTIKAVSHPGKCLFVWVFIGEEYFQRKTGGGRRAAPVDLMQSSSITSVSRPVAARNKFKLLIQWWHMETLTLQMPPGHNPAPLTAGVLCCFGMFGHSLPCSALLPANETMLKYLVDWIHSRCRRGVPNCSYYTNIKMESAGCAEAICVFPRSEIFFRICWRLIGLFNLMNMVNRFYGLGQPVPTSRQD